MISPCAWLQQDMSCPCEEPGYLSTTDADIRVEKRCDVVGAKVELLAADKTDQQLPSTYAQPVHMESVGNALDVARTPVDD